MTTSLADRPGAAVIAELLHETEGMPDFGVDVAATLRWVRRVGAVAPLPGGGRTAELWDLLADTAAVDVAAARMLEPHLDALAILAQAREAGMPEASADPGSGTWGVFAAEAAGVSVVAADRGAGNWRLSGTKPWCSLAASLDHALITARVGEERGLFAIDLRAPGVRVRSGPWTARGLPGVVSAPIDLDDVPAVPVGDPGWYLRRPGFAWGGAGVAAVWWGGARPLVARMVDAAAGSGADQVALIAAGAADAASWSSARSLAAAARHIDEQDETGTDAKLLVARLRAVVSAAVRRILDLERAALGPGPVATDEAHGRRVADLDLYVRQDHADRDLARLGRLAGTER